MAAHHARWNRRCHATGQQQAEGGKQKRKVERAESEKRKAESKRPMLSHRPFLLGGSPTWARTRDLRINSPALYRLSYRGTAEKEIITTFSLFRQQLFNVLLSCESVTANINQRSTEIRSLCARRQNRLLAWLAAWHPGDSATRTACRAQQRGRIIASLFRLCQKKTARRRFFSMALAVLSRTPAIPRRESCAASAKSSCTACGSSFPGRCTARRRTLPARLRGSRTGSVSSCRGRC